MERIIDHIKSIDKDRVIYILKKYWLRFSIGLIIILLGIGYLMGSSATSKSRVLAKLQDSLVTCDSKELQKIIKINNKGVDIDKLEPLLKYYKQDSSRISSTMKLLKTTGESNDFALKTEKGFLGTKYYLEVKVYNVTITSNYDEGKFYLDKDKKNKIISGSQFKSIIPGIHNVNGVLKGEYSDIKASKEIVLMDNENIKLNFNAINIIINSNYTDAEIYINDQKTNNLVRDKKEFGPLATDGSIKVYIQKSFPWGTIKSKSQKVKDNPNISLEINMKNDELLNQVSSSVEDFYYSVFDSLNHEDKSVIDNSSDEVKDEMYKTFEKNYFLLKNRYNITSLKINEEASEFSYVDGEYYGRIVTNIKYEISKIILPFDKDKFEKDFFVEIKYVDGKWQIQKVDNFSL